MDLKHGLANWKTQKIGETGHCATSLFIFHLYFDKFGLSPVFYHSLTLALELLPLPVLGLSSISYSWAHTCLVYSVLN